MNLVESLKGEIANLQDAIIRIQEDCNHENKSRIKTFRSTFSNYTVFRCADCDKEWTEHHY